MTVTTAPLTSGDVFAYAEVLNGIVSHSKCRLLLDSGDILTGILRYLDGDQGAPRPADVREAHVRITSVTGFEYWVPFVELAAKFAIGEFAVDREV